MSEGEMPVGERLNALLAEAGMPILGAESTSQFESLLSYFVRWNSRVNLSAIRDTDGILSRHFVESIACARALPDGIKTMLDFGSGGGVPGIPIAICRPEIEVTLAESQGKKAAFLQEAVRKLGIHARVHSARAEMLGEKFDCVILRAVDKMAEAVSLGAKLVQTGGWLALMTTGAELDRQSAAAGAEFRWESAALLPGSVDRILALGMRSTVRG
jgi:16S rRNA (guanine527-N7)-methyltransferase